MKINVISDIHAQNDALISLNPYNSEGFKANILYPNGFSYEKLAKKDVDVLVFCGDFGYTYRDFSGCFHDLSHFCEKNSQEFVYCKGNHDYYVAILSHLDKDYTFPDEDLVNVKHINGVSFITFTGWTPIFEESLIVKQCLTDYRAIPEYTIEKNNGVSKKQWDNFFEVLAKEEADDTVKQIVIVTHHIPLKDLIAEKHKGSKINEAFCMMDTEMNEKIKKALRNSKKIEAWCYGHTHTPNDTVIEGCHFVCNPMGYPNERNLFVSGVNHIIEF